MTDEREARLERKRRLARAFTQSVPHNEALGMKLIDLDDDGVVFELPYAAHLVGNPDTGTLHGGAITALLDASSGIAVFGALDKLVPIATLDLRIDYLKPAEPRRTVLCKATCYKLTHNVAFTRAVAYHGDPDDAIAHAVGTFMLSTKMGSHVPGRAP
ncbi:MAG TPA: PaaI family thioesterase [Kofleriaceae bacterium]|nr:PaaI family thioesterase [Kofleriaceae bacterium]